jgi:hypothetical protein
VKYLLAYKFRLNGSVGDNEASMRRAFELFAKFKPVEGLTVHQLMGRLDGNGGFSILETDKPLVLADQTTKFNVFAEYEIYPVADLPEVIALIGEGMAFRDRTD